MTSHPRLVALGSALPAIAMSSEDYADFAVRQSARIPREAALIHAIGRRTGIATRHSVLAELHDGAIKLPFYESREESQPRVPTTGERMDVYAREAPPLALRAATDALRNAELPAASITHLITASCTGFVAPGIDYQMMTGLTLDPSTPRTHIGFMGCHAAVNALGAARSICLADPNAIVLGVMVELCTLHCQPGLHRDSALPNALFADGAAAFLLAGAQVKNPRSTGWELAETRSHIIPGTADLMTWRIVDTGFRMTLDASVPDVIASRLPHLAESWGWHDSPTTAWGLHPGGPRILDAATRALRLPVEKTAKSRAVLSRIGNVSSPTVLFILNDLLHDAGQSDTIRLMAFGPGLAVEAAEFRCFE